MSKDMYKYTVLTYVFGEYEKLREIDEKGDLTDYVCVTDNPNLKSSTWRIILRQNLPGKSSFDKVCYVRYHPFEFVDTDIVLKLDGSIKIKKSMDDIFNIFCINDYEMLLMIHPLRNTIEDEYEEWRNIRGIKNDDIERHKRFIYDDIHLEKNYKGLYQLCYWIQRNDEYNNSLNDEAYNILLLNGNEEGIIARPNQAIVSALINKKYFSDKIMFVSQLLITNSNYMSWREHKTDIPIHTEIPCMLKPYAFNKQVNNIYNFADVNHITKCSKDNKCVDLENIVVY